MAVVNAVTGHFGTLVPGEGTAKQCRHSIELGAHDSVEQLSALAVDKVQKNEIAARPFDEGTNGPQVATSHDQNPLQWPGTSLSSTSRGRSAIMTMFGFLPRRSCLVPR